MRYVNGFFCALFVLFAVVQYNDPDAMLWILIYGITAIWAGLAAFRPDRLAHSQPLLAAFGVTLVAIAGGALYAWPQSIADWWDNEVVREGLGLIIATVALLAVAYTLWRTRREPRLAGQAG
jgi:peptidoglycan/LPS O-acetylase OafA/YrhL